MLTIKEKNSDMVLQETSDMFQSQGISILGEGYKEIATNAQLFQAYKEKLLEGTNANDYAVLDQLMTNTNTNILVESSTTGITPIASLSMPVIRKLWPKFALKKALKEEVAKSPRFVISYTKPYLFRGKVDGTEERVYLPKGLKDASGMLSDAGKKKEIKKSQNLTNAAASATVDFSTDATVTSTPSSIKRIPLDRDFKLASVTVTGDGTNVASTATYVVNQTLDINNTIVYELAVPNADDASVVQQNITILVRVDLQAANAKVTAFGIDGTEVTAVNVSFVAPLTSEFNEESWSVSFDLERKDVQIPTGQHLNAPIPLELLQDAMALYQIDGTKEITELMTNTFAMKLDLEVLDFLKNSYMNQPSFYDKSLPTASAYTVTFDARPAAGYAHGPKEWREQLKIQIDFLAQKIKNETYLNSGMFVIVANPIDAQLISNIDWQFRGGQGANVDGVDVDYSVGTYVGANAYRIISSVNVPAGVMFLVFLPSTEKQMTYKYYPYSFSVEQGYIDPNRSRVPSIMMTKRHTFAEVLPAIGAINVLNNDGAGMFNPYIQTKAWNASDWDEVETYPKD